jgi:frizzled
MPDEVKAMENINNFSTILSTENYSNDNLTSNIDDEIELDEDQPMKIPINSQSQQTTFWWKLTQSQNMYNKVATLLTCPTNFTLNEMGTYCIYKCETDAYYSTHQKKVIETCILVFSVICFIFTLFSLITFWTESARFDFPERPILFLTLCYNLLSLSFIFKIFYQKSTTTMQILNTQISEEVVEFNSIKATELIENQCSIDSKCLIYFIIVSYLIISASFWWLIFGLCWWLSASQQWSPEALEKKSGLFHVIAWLLPISFPTAALLFGVIEKVESIGMCTAFGFTEYPTLILLIIGELFIILSAKSLKRLELSWKNDKLAQVTSKILMFGIIFVAPMIISILLMLFDYDKVLKPCLPGEICYQPEKRKINITVIRYACLLIGGIICGSWVWSKKTCLSCRKKITIQYYSNSSSPQTMIETLNSLPAKQTAYNKYVNSLHKSLLSNNYSVKKQHVSEIQKTPEKVDWISSPYRSN